MADRTENSELDVPTPSQPYAGIVENSGTPIRFKNFQDIKGICLEVDSTAGSTTILPALAITSDEPAFHWIMDGMERVILWEAQREGIKLNLRRQETTLLVIRPDCTAELWLDTAAEVLHVLTKRSISPGTAAFETDIADVIGKSFPRVAIGPKDKVFCVFREGWRFGMIFDYNPDGDFDITSFEQNLGALYRDMRYRHLYDALGDNAVTTRMIASGWFPFVEIIQEMKDLLPQITSSVELSNFERTLLKKFDPPRTQRLLDRWSTKPHLASRSDLLKAAVNAFDRQDPISVIKILLTEIEGVLNDAYRAVNEGASARLKELLRFAMDSAERKAGGSNTLLFPKTFAEYLAKQTFANFDRSCDTGTASSRHAVGHGAAAQATYTMVRALQVMLTLDQLAFYT